MNELLILLGLVVVGWILLSPLFLFGLWTKVDDLEKQFAKLRQESKSKSAANVVQNYAARQPVARKPTPPREPPPEPPTPVPLDIEDFLEEPNKSPTLQPQKPEKPPELTPTSPSPQPTASHHPANPPMAAAMAKSDASSTISKDSSLTFEEILAGQWMTWVGAIAVVIGAGFFFKYAIEQGWIGPETRVLIGITGGVACFVGGVIGMRKNYDAFAQGMVGAALGILYFSLFASARWYQPPVFSDPVAFSGMVLATVAALTFAAVYEAQAAAVLALLGGFLTPIMLSRGVDARWTLFPYLLMLDLGVLGIASFRRWPRLNSLAFGGTLLMWLGWFGNHYHPDKLGDVVILMSLFFVVFSALGVWHHLVRRTIALPEDFFLVIATPSIFFATFFLLTKTNHQQWQPVMAIGMAVLYEIFGNIARRRVGVDPKISFAFNGLAIVFLVIAVPLKFTGHWVAIAWAALSAVLVEMGLRFNEPKLRKTGLSLLCIVFGILSIYAVTTITGPDRFSTLWVQRAASDLIVGQATTEVTGWQSVFNGRSLSFLAAIVVTAGLAWRYRTFAKSAESDVSLAGDLQGQFASLLGISIVTTLGMVLLETYVLWWHWGRFVPSLLSLLAIETAVFGSVVLIVSAVCGHDWLKQLGTTIFAFSGMAVGGVFLHAIMTRYFTLAGMPTEWWDWPMLNPRALGILGPIVLASITAAVVVRYSPDKPSTTEDDALDLSRSLVGISIVAGLGLVLLESYVQWWHLDRYPPTLISVFAIETAVFASGILIAAGVRGHSWLKSLGTTIFGFTGLAVIIAFLNAVAGSELYLKDVPNSWWTLALVNPRGLGFLVPLVLAMTTAAVLRRTDDRTVTDHQTNLTTASTLALAAILAGWGWLTGEARVWGVQHDWATLTGLAITLVWTGYSLATLLAGIAVRSANLRKLSLAFFGLTIGKVFLVDVWHLHATIRTFAFIALGGTLLLVSWLYRRYRQRIRDWIEADTQPG